MIIKKYQGKNEADAKEKAVKELGQDICIMNVKEVKYKGIKRLFKAPFTEITVALEEESEPPVSKQLLKQPLPTLKNGQDKKESPASSKVDVRIDDNVVNQFHEDEKALQEKLDSIHSLLKEQIKEQEKNQDKNESVFNQVSGNSSADKKEESDSKRKDTVLDLIRDTLLDNEVDAKYVETIMEEAENILNDDTPMEYILSHIYQRMILRFGNADIIKEASEGPKVIFFVGTTGVGKTTTIAKIASKFIVDDKKKTEARKVALITADTYRIAAAEQLKTYANILNIPFRVVYTTEEMGLAVKDFWEYDYIFVDTAGHSQNNDEQRDNMSEFIEYVKQYAETEVFLVLSATTKYKDLKTIADKYKKTTEYKLIFTKLDETTTYGNLMNLRIYTGAPISYVTYGQNVPDDFDTFNPQSTVKKLLGGN